MDVTRVSIQPSPTGNPLCYATLVLDGQLQVHGVKLISLPADPPGGKHPYPRVFLAFPSHQVRRLCPGCRTKVRLQDRYCSSCGVRLTNLPPPYGRYEEVHPTTTEFRRHLTEEVERAYRAWARLPWDRPLPTGKFPSRTEDLCYRLDEDDEAVGDAPCVNGEPPDGLAEVEERHG